MKLLGVIGANVHNICLKMNDTCIPSYCMDAVHLAEQNRSTKEKMDRPTPMKTEQALNGLYPAVAAADE